MISAWIEAIRALPGEVRSTVTGLNDQQLDTPYRDGGWTVRQVVHHLADSHMNGFVRMRLIMTEDSPVLKPYDQDRWALLDDSRTLPLEPSLAILDGLHARWAALLGSIRDDGTWRRTAHHPESGEVMLESLLALYATHGRHHLAQIIQLRERMGWNVDGELSSHLLAPFVAS